MTEETTTPVDDQDDDGARTGVCVDGPLAGQQLDSRYPKGVLLCDRPAGQLWIYDWTGDGFTSRSGADPMPLVEDDTADDNRWRAADEGDYDVLAAPWAGGDPDQVDAYADQDVPDDEAGEDTDVPGQ